MSVQAGIWNFDGRPVDPKLLADFSESMSQQGPDGESCYVDGSIAMLYRPFHTTGESRREKQPYRSHRGFILTWDGRLDNREGLIAELRSYLGVEPTDVAIIAAAFDHWETDSFRRIVGDWAVSIWKPGQRELILASDYIAIRHIFYYLKDDRISWATDLAPLVLLTGDKFHIEDDYIAGYFAYDPDAHLTPYREIREAPPAQFLRIRNGTGVAERYWRFSPKHGIRYKSDEEYEEHFRYVFRQSVRRRLRSDSPVLAELSGGLDSSSIVCVADEILAKNGTQAPRLDTLSYYDKTEPQGDDWIYFPKIESKRGRVGHHIDSGNLGRAPASLQCTAFNPLPGYLGFGQTLDAERAVVMRTGGYRVVFSGIGGDEFMGGIPNPGAQLGDLIVQLKFIRLAQQLMAWGLVKRRPWIQLLYQSLLGLLPASLGQYLVNEARVEDWIDKDFARRTKLSIRLLGPNGNSGSWLPTHRSHIAGIAMMANKLAKLNVRVLTLEEVRYPYLDQNLIEFVLSVPASQLLRPGERRSLMRRSLDGVVPQEILSRRTKQFGARTPVVALEKNLEELQMAFKSPLSSSLGYVNQARLIEALEAARNGKSIHTVHLLRTVSLEFWLRSLEARRLLNSYSASTPLVVPQEPSQSASPRPETVSITPASRVVRAS